MKDQTAKYLIGLGTMLLLPSLVSADPFMSSVTLGSQTPANITAGDSATYSISITKTNSGGIDAYLTISGLPAGASASFSPTPIVMKSTADSGTSTLTITTTSAVANGTYPFVVTAEDGSSGNTMTANGTLVVGGANSQAQLPFILSISLSGPQTPTLVVSGSANQKYVIQATADLGNPSWSTITTNMTDGSGLFSYTDSSAGSFSSRFYRAALPQ